MNDIKDDAKTPAISIITPVFNGAATVERAVRSVVSQTFPDWELLLIDDCSTDATPAILQGWAERDPRIRPLRTARNSGECAARNVGLNKNARGEFFCYLDHDDEFYPDYFAQIAKSRAEGKVLIFWYDQITDGSNGQIRTWRPETVRQRAFQVVMAIPLGVAHHRSMYGEIGGFNETLWKDGDWDFVKRLARTGEEFVFVKAKSGLYHIRQDSMSRRPRLTRPQRETVEANRLAGKPLFGPRPKKGWLHPVRKVVFASPHSLIDYYNGEAIATVLRICYQYDNII